MATQPTEQSTSVRREGILHRRGKALKALLGLMATGGAISAQWRDLVGATRARRRQWINELLSCGLIRREARGIYRFNISMRPVPSCLATMTELDLRVWMAIDPDRDDELLACDPTYLAHLTAIRRHRVRTSLRKFTSTGDLIPVTGWLYVYGSQSFEAGGLPFGQIPVSQGNSSITPITTIRSNCSSNGATTLQTANLPKGEPSQSKRLTIPSAFEPYWNTSGETRFRGSRALSIPNRLRFCWDVSLHDYLAPLTERLSGREPGEESDGVGGARRCQGRAPRCQAAWTRADLGRCVGAGR